MYGWCYYYNMYMPHRMVRRVLADLIYRYAEYRYGGPMKPIGTKPGPDESQPLVYVYSPEDLERKRKWHRLMNLKNRVCNIK